MKPAIEIKNLSKCFTTTVEARTLFRLCKKVITGNSYCKKIQALDNLNFQVEKSEKIGIIGANGAGKTTLIRIMLGIYKQDTGSVEISGKISGCLESSMQMQRDLNILDNIYLLGALVGLDRKQINKRFDTIIDFSGLRNFINLPLRDFSTGMMQRLVISVMKEADSDILVLDEMLLGSDMIFREKFFQLLEDYRHTHKTVIMASHSMDMIERFCEKALLLDQGRQIAFGPVKDIIKLYKKRVSAERFQLFTEKDTTKNA